MQLIDEWELFVIFIWVDIHALSPTQLIDEYVLFVMLICVWLHAEYHGHAPLQVKLMVFMLLMLKSDCWQENFQQVILAVVRALGDEMELVVMINWLQDGDAVVDWQFRVRFVVEYTIIVVVLHA